MGLYCGTGLRGVRREPVATISPVDERCTAAGSTGDGDIDCEVPDGYAGLGEGTYDDGSLCPSVEVVVFLAELLNGDSEGGEPRYGEPGCERGRLKLLFM